MMKLFFGVFRKFCKICYYVTEKYNFFPILTELFVKIYRVTNKNINNNNRKVNETKMIKSVHI